MSPSDIESFPVELVYLIPVLENLKKISERDLDEDLDATLLESVLRKRIKGLHLPDAVGRLTEDSEILKKWLKKTKVKDGAAIWISAFLKRPGALARDLLAPVSPPDPIVDIDLPSGWSHKTLPRQLILSKDKVSCSFTLADKSSYQLRLKKNEVREQAQAKSSQHFPQSGRWLKSAVKAGESLGYKYSYSQPAPAKWKAVEYVLEVKGGFVNVQLTHEKGKDFDESEIEGKLHTLKVLPS
ncbi:MAG TPA: hypothetical protein VN873_06135 [Candidatus Angelobacter sp.]|nr:hypothetical protein [Candidatus Angelobacter sp.]